MTHCRTCNNFGSTTRANGIEEPCICQMNYLQHVGAISDNCIEPADIAEADREKAMMAIKGDLGL